MDTKIKPWSFTEYTRIIS